MYCYNKVVTDEFCAMHLLIVKVQVIWSLDITILKIIHYAVCLHSEGWVLLSRLSPININGQISFHLLLISRLVLHEEENLSSKIYLILLILQYKNYNLCI